MRRPVDLMPLKSTTMARQASTEAGGGSLSTCHTVLTPVELLWAVLKSTGFLPWQHVILALEATRLHSSRPTQDQYRAQTVAFIPEY
jgi:hypothetical protein